MTLPANEPSYRSKKGACIYLYSIIYIQEKGFSRVLPSKTREAEENAVNHHPQIYSDTAPASLISVTVLCEDASLRPSCPRKTL